MLPSVLDHFGLLNLAEYGANVAHEKLCLLSAPNFVNLPWSFPARRLRIVFEVLDMYNFASVLACPHINNRYVKRWKKQSLQRFYAQRNSRNYHTSLRSNIKTVFLKLNF